MAFIQLSESRSDGIRIMIFTEGTILKPKSGRFLFSFQNYVPIGDSVAVISRWIAQGARIDYCTSRKGRSVQVIAQVLGRFSLPGERLYYRGKGEAYKDIVEAVKPDVLIEDDCKSIGGARQMCITHVAPEIRKNIQSIIVGEFEGIDQLSGFSFEKHRRKMEK